MVKANIETSSGTKIFIEGKPEDISQVMRLFEGKEHNITEARNSNIKSKKMKKGGGLTTCVRELKGEGFFDKPKDLISIKQELAKKAHIYPVTSIQPTLLNLVKAKELGRLKEDSKWVYVRR